MSKNISNNITRKKKNSSGSQNLSGTSSNSFQNNRHQQSFLLGNESSGLPKGHNTSMNLRTNPLEPDLNSRKNISVTLDCSGNKPSPRFGHSVILINKVKVCLFGGAAGDTKNFNFVNDTFVLNLMTRIWIKVVFPQGVQLPIGRAAHAAAANDNMQMVIHGGSIGGSNLAPDELWLFDMKNNNEEEGKWMLVNTVGRGPGRRYGHTLAYMKPHFVLMGGNLNPDLSNDVWIIDINAQQPKWTKLEFSNNTVPSPRLYHTCGFFTKGNAIGMMVVFGGRDALENPLNDIWGLRRHRDGTWDWVMAVVGKGEKIHARYNHSVAFYGTLMIIIGGRSRNSHEKLPTEVYDYESSEAFSFPGLGLHRQSSFIFDKYIYLYGGFQDGNQLEPLGLISKISLENLFEKSPLSNKVAEYSKTSHMTKITQNSQKNQPKFKLTHDVVVGSTGEVDEVDDTSNLFRKVSIEKLPKENQRLGKAINSQTANALLQSRREFDFDLINLFIENLLRPFDWFDNSKMDEIHQNFPFTDSDIFSLLEEVKPVLEKDKSLIRIRSPCKIFGNLYGGYNDLMRYFESFGHPSDDTAYGDINVMQYVFLGDFCDRGYYSLEIVLLLFALKVKYPDYIYILRGHHEDINVNASYGLGQECKERLSDEITNNNSIFKAINRIFDLLPYAVLVDNTILCLHGGIGSALNSLSDIENIKRPTPVVQEVTNSQQQIILDILWSEYSDDVETVDVNTERDKNKYGFIVKYGKERLNKFLNDNKLTLLITSHQFVPDGFMTFNEDKLLTFLSATNYMDKYRNSGVMINIPKKIPGKPVSIMPKLINVYEGQKDCYRKNKSPSPIRDIKN